MTTPTDLTVKEDFLAKVSQLAAKNQSYYSLVFLPELQELVKDFGNLAIWSKTEEKVTISSGTVTYAKPGMETATFTQAEMSTILAGKLIQKRGIQATNLRILIKSAWEMSVGQTPTMTVSFGPLTVLRQERAARKQR